MHNIYIDEAGLPGNTGQDYFVLGVVIVSIENVRKFDEDIKTICRDFSLEELKYSSTSNRDNEKILLRINEMSFQATGFPNKKNHILQKEQNLLKEDLCFSSILGLLAALESTIYQANLFIDGGRSDNLLKRLQKRVKERFGNKVQKIDYVDSKECRGVQVADYVANALKNKYFRGDESFYKIIESHFINIPSWNVVGNS